MAETLRMMASAAGVVALARICGDPLAMLLSLTTHSLEPTNGDPENSGAVIQMFPPLTDRQGMSD